MQVRALPPSLKPYRLWINRHFMVDEKDQLQPGGEQEALATDTDLQQEPSTAELAAADVPSEEGDEQEEGEDA